MGAGVVDFEPRAWLEHVLDNPDDVLDNPGGPDFDRYLGQHHSADL